MAHTITIDGVGNAMNTFLTKHGKKLNTSLKEQLELDTMLDVVSCDYSYEGKDGEISGLLQAYQPQFTPNNAETYTGHLNILEYGKVDLEITLDTLETWFNKYMNKFFEAGKNERGYKYVNYIMDQLVLPQVIEEINQCSWRGIRVAPTPGTAGVPLATYTGFGKRITDFIAGGDLTPITTGAFADATMEAQIIDFCKAVPYKYRFKKGTILMSKTNALRYAEDVEAKHPGRRESEENHNRMYLRVDKMNKTIVGLDSMEGSDRIVLIFDNLSSMILGRRNGYSALPTFRVHTDVRQLKIVAEMPRFYGFETLKHIFVNDQA